MTGCADSNILAISALAWKLEVTMYHNKCLFIYKYFNKQTNILVPMVKCLLYHLYMIS